MGKSSTTGMATLLQFLATGLVWGSSYMWIAMALEDISWQFLTWIRPILGMITLGIVLLIQRPKDAHGYVLPRQPKIWRHYLVVGLLFTAVPSSLYALALGGISSGMVSIYSATAPLLTALVAGLIFRVEKLGVLNWLGVIVGAAGVTLVIQPWNITEESSFISELCVLLAVLSVAIAYVYQMKFNSEFRLHPTVIAFLIAVGASAISVVLSPWLLVGTVRITQSSLIALAVLGILVAAYGYIWNAAVVDAWGATGASTVAYLNPIVGVLAGALVLGEQLSPIALIGGLVIFAGIAIERLHRK